MLSVESEPRSEVRELARKKAKGGDVFEVGPGLAHVIYGHPIHCYSDLITECGWYIDTIFENEANNEVGIIIMPLSSLDFSDD